MCHCVFWLFAAVLSSGFCRAAEPRKTNLLIVGATESGWAAAIQAARMGVKSITIVHDGEWVGGQFTEQSLACVDEDKGVGNVGWGVDWHPMKRSFHRSGLFKELMDQIEAYNTKKYGSPMPGRPYHGPSTFRPAEAEAIFRQMLEPYLESGQINLVTNHYPISATASANQLTAITFAPLEKSDTASEFTISAKLTIDASDWGEVIQLAGAAFECGPDPRSRYGEPSAPGDHSNIPPNEMNPITWAMVIEEFPGADLIPEPPHFDDRSFVRSTQIGAKAFAGLGWDRPADSLSGIPHWPDAGRQSPRQLSVYTVRRIVDGTASKDGKTSILLNYMLGQDYPLERLPKHVANALDATGSGASEKNIVTLTRPQRAIIFADAKRQSLALLHHFQTFVHDRAPDKANSFRNFRLSREFGTPDHLPPKPYIRESLRLKALYMMREQDGRNRDGASKDHARERFSHVLYPDGVFCWQFHYDFHRTGRAYLKSEGESGPWIDYEKPGRHTRHVSDRSLFPLRSLIPEKFDGLLGAQGNIGYSSIVSAAIRLHDQRIHIGQATGAAAAIALKHEIQPRTIPFERSLLEEVKAGLCNSSFTPLLLFPFRDLPADHSSFVAVSRLASLRILTQDAYDVDFHPDVPASPTWQKEVDSLIAAQFPIANLAKPNPDLTRAQFCSLRWADIKNLSPKPFPRLKPDDADADGIPDLEDPLPFTAAPPVVWEVEKPPPPPPARDGIPDKPTIPASYQFNFAGKNAAPVADFALDSGLPFDPKRGHGWSRDISKDNRQRGIFRDEPRDTFLFTRTIESWECTLPDGDYLVTLCLGDSAHPQPGQQIAVEGVPSLHQISTAAGEFHEFEQKITVADGRLTVLLGSLHPGGNTCLNWLRIAPLKK